VNLFHFDHLLYILRIAAFQFSFYLQQPKTEPLSFFAAASRCGSWLRQTAQPVVIIEGNAPAVKTKFFAAIFKTKFFAAIFTCDNL